MNNPDSIEKQRLIDEIVAGRITVGFSYITTAIPQQYQPNSSMTNTPLYGEAIEQQTEAMIQSATDAIASALDAYNMTDQDWSLVFEIGGRVQANLYRLWNNVVAAVDVVPETGLPRIQFSAEVAGKRTRYIHLIKSTDWEVLKAGRFDSQLLSQLVIDNFIHYFNEGQ